MRGSSVVGRKTSWLGVFVGVVAVVGLLAPSADAVLVHAARSPSAAFDVTTAHPVAGSATRFDASASSEPGGSISSYTWTFGDGSATGSGVTPSHTYASPGTYTVTLTVADASGNTASVAHPVAVQGPLTASFTQSGTHVTAGSPVSFDGSNSSEPGGSIASYSWNFGDGTSGSGIRTSHAYLLAGIYTVALTVTDAAGASATSRQPILVSSVAFAAIASIRGDAIAGVPVSFDGSQSQDTGSFLTMYSWSFGDGGHATGLSATHTFAKTGAWTVTLTVVAADGSPSTAAVAISVKAPSITKVKVKKGNSVQRLSVTVNGPGVLKVGSKRFHARKPKTITVNIKLSQSQLDTLLVTHQLTLKVKLKFVPTSGKTSRKTVKIKLNR